MSNFDATSIATAETFAKIATDQFPRPFQGAYGIKVNRNYIKVFSTNEKGEPRSVYCFIDKDGYIWKPAGWNAPTKNFARGNVVDIVSSGVISDNWAYGL